MSGVNYPLPKRPPKKLNLGDTLRKLVEDAKEKAKFTPEVVEKMNKINSIITADDKLRELASAGMEKVTMFKGHGTECQFYKQAVYNIWYKFREDNGILLSYRDHFLGGCSVEMSWTSSL